MLIQTGADCAGKRLDRYLAESVGRMGLRGWRRAIRLGHILVNGQPGRAGIALHGGECVEIGEIDKIYSGLKGTFLGRYGGYLFFYKPAGLHTVGLAGSREDSLENQLWTLCRGREGAERLELLQRLDQGTAGIICAAPDSESVLRFREAERSGSCRKAYLALLQGHMEAPVRISSMLHVNGRKKARIGCSEDENSWTEFEPLWSGEIKEYKNIVTIAKCTLCAGKRHQIRAHASSLGFPLIGDRMYGSSEQERFALLHYRIELPDCIFQYFPPDSPFIQLGCSLGADGRIQCI